MVNKYELLENLLILGEEYEWLDFKENWFSKDEIGEYISAISNGAAICGKNFGYIVWGVEDLTKTVVGTRVHFDKDVDGEPYKHYLARYLKPSISFNTFNVEFNGKNVFILEIPAAKSVPTKFKDEKYIRIGSSKEKLSRFPEWEMKLNQILNYGFPTIVNIDAPEYAQELTFEKLFLYYAAKGIGLKQETFKKNLKLLSPSGKFNIMAYILSDQNSIPIRVSIFSGYDKSAPLFSVKEFGNTCIMYSMDKILEYGDAINIIQADETNRISERNDIPLFDYEAFHEAVLNAFVHNKWLTLNGPSISIFKDRIEILSFGGLAIDQDVEGFYQGASLPVNDILASIFLQLRLSERSGRGVPKIVKSYGREAIKIEKNRITVTIRFRKNSESSFTTVTNKASLETIFKINKTQEKILELIRNNPNITIQQMCSQLSLSIPGIKKNLSILKKNQIIERVGSNTSGYWQIIE